MPSTAQYWLVVQLGLFTLGIAISTGLIPAAIWCAAGLTVHMIWRAVAQGQKTSNTTQNKLAASTRMVEFITHIVWAFAPILVWQSATNFNDILAYCMVGAGLVYLLKGAGLSGRRILMMSLPYLAVIGVFVIQSRSQPSFLVLVMGLVIFGVGFTQIVSTKSTQARQHDLLAKQNALEVEKMTQSRNKVEGENRMRTEFLAYISHELRTPLNGIMALSDLMVSEELSKPQNHKMNLIKESSDNMLVLLNDILDVSKIDADRISLDPEGFDTNAGFQRHYDFWTSFADKKGVNLRYRKQKDLPETLVLDRHRLCQCLNNLVSNAIKFSEPDSEVTVTIHGKPIKGRYGLCLTVRDHGIGMDEEQVSRLFKPFEQGAKSHSRVYGGTGLGLVITRKLAKLMGGDVAVQSKEGQGSIFSMTLMVDVQKSVENPMDHVEAAFKVQDVIAVPDETIGEPPQPYQVNQAQG